MVDIAGVWLKTLIFGCAKYKKIHQKYQSYTIFSASHTK